MNKIEHKIKVLFPALHYPPVIGGIERWTKEISERLSAKAEVFVITGKVAGENKEQRRDSFHLIRVSLFKLKNLSHSPCWYTLHLLPFIYFKSASIVKKQKINLIHCNGFLSGVLGYLLNKRFAIPYIITIQSLEGGKPLQGIKKRVYGQASACIAVSRAVADDLEKAGVNKQNIVIIPNGIDTSRFQGINKQKARQELGLDQNDFIVITVGRLDKRKGIKYLLQAVNDLIINYQLLIIGDGEERHNLEKLTKELGLQDKASFIGEVANSDLPEYLAAADCFCLPSIEEGFGIVILEAMTAGLPIVATKVGGITDIIQHNQNGILVEPKNSQAISQAIASIQQNPDLAQQLISQAKQTLLKYSWQNISHQVYQVHEKCLKF